MYRNCTYLLNFARPHQQPSPVLNNCCRFKFVKSSSRSVGKPQLKQLGTLETLTKASESDVPLPPSSLIRPTIFTILFSSASFAGATIWQYENMRYHAREMFRSPKKWLKDSMEPSQLWIQEKFKGGFQIKQGSFRQLCNKLWNSLSEGQKIFVPILFVNVLVYAAWKVPSMSGIMARYFVTDSARNAAGKISCWPLLLSTFSHCGGVHLCVNMYVLNTFISTLVNNLGKEQFLAFYVSAGVFASLASLAYRVLCQKTFMSLGASGSIMGIIGYFGFKFPDNMLSIIFLPFIMFSASTGVKAIMAMDFTCLLLNKKIFDHAAHLGGAFFGIFWYYWGNTYIWQKRGPILEWWHEWRTRSMR